jgi:hypothetical protein
LTGIKKELLEGGLRVPACSAGQIAFAPAGSASR